MKRKIRMTKFKMKKIKRLFKMKMKHKMKIVNKIMKLIGVISKTKSKIKKIMMRIF